MPNTAGSEHAQDFAELEEHLATCTIMTIIGLLVGVLMGIFKVSWRDVCTSRKG